MAIDALKKILSAVDELQKKTTPSDIPQYLVRPEEQLTTPEIPIEAPVADASNQRGLDFLNSLKQQPQIEIPYRAENDPMLSSIGVKDQSNGLQDIFPAQKESQQEAPAEEKSTLSKIGSMIKSQPSSPEKDIVQQAVNAATQPTDLADKEYTDAQERTRQNRMYAGMLAAATQAAGGIAGLGAGKSVDLDTSGVKRLLEQQNVPVADLTAKRAAEKTHLDLMDDRQKNDPNSPVSQMMRDTILKLSPGMKIPANFTAAQAEKIFPSITKVLEQENSRKDRAIRQAELSEMKAQRQQTQMSAVEQKKMDNIAKGMTTFRGDPAAGKASDALRRAEMAQRLLEKPDWTKEERELFAGELSSLVKGGVPTEHELKNILPDTAVARVAKAMTFITNEPQNVDDTAYKKRMTHYLQELKEINQQYLDKRKEKVISLGGYKHLSEEAKDLIRAEEPEIAARLDGKPLAKKETQQESKGTVSKNTLQDYAKQHKIDVNTARQLLTKAGYNVQ